MTEPQVFRWLLDVQHLWPSPLGDSHRTGATAQWGNTHAAKEALDFLPLNEREKALRFFAPRDAKLSLASSLLKHRAIVRACRVPWSAAIVGQDANRKPCFIPSIQGTPKVEFNVSHHGTLVALVGCAGDNCKLGVDIVHIDWAKDYPSVLKNGFPKWARIFESVYSEREMRDIIGYQTGEREQEADISGKLRHFYAHWCLKEAYVKMNGEALVASWVQELEFRNVKVPLPLSRTPSSDCAGLWGQTYNDAEIWLRGVRVADVQLELQAYGEDYLIATAGSSTGNTFSAFKKLDLLQDVYPTDRDTDQGEVHAL
ncbi:MAG: hypothetical protein Q9191_005151 [Dirinaria sp. TL-2023a]